MLTRRELFVSLAALPQRNTVRRQVEQIFDDAGINFDSTVDKITVKVDGDQITGTEGGEVILKFSKAGRLTGVVVWNEAISDGK